MATTLEATSVHRMTGETVRDGRVRCEACGELVVPEKPSRAWWLLVVLGYALALGLSPIACIFPLSLLGIPLLFTIALPLLGLTHDKVRQPATCPSCRRYMG